LDVTFHDVAMAVVPDKQSATANVTVEANAVDEKDSMIQEVKFKFKKTAEGRLIKRVETIRLLS
jgi:hypothetical protein